MKLLIRAIGCLLWVAVSGHMFAQELNASILLENVERGFQGVTDYEVTVVADINMDRIHAPKMRATMYFKKPDKVHFASPSFLMLPREGIVVNPSLLREKYRATTLGEEEIDGRKLHKLQLTAKDSKTRSRQMILWIDPSNWTIARMETIPYQGRVLRLALTYSLEAGKFWLPRTLQASFESVVQDTTKRIELDTPASQQWDEMRRPLRNGSITIKYSDYRVNVGLADEIFERRDSQPKD